MAVRTLDELDLEGKRVFIRVDFNVPVDEDRSVTDDQRIRAALPTIRHAVEAKARVILASHLGRPKGKPNPKYSLEPAGERLSELLDESVMLADDCVGDGVRKMVQDLSAGGVLLLENLRFHPGEEANDPAFAKELASFADVWVMDAFGTAHRAHASTAGMAAHVKERAAGFLVRKELDYLGRSLDDPKTPFVVILGGAKVSDKIKVIDSLIARCQSLLIGGAMAYTFLAARGEDVGSSRVEKEAVEKAERILGRAKERGVELLLPVDHVVAESMEGQKRRITEGAGIPKGMMGLDIGPRTVDLYRERIAAAGTVFWNGPLGLFEKEPFSHGTFAIARSLAESSCVSIVGGGDSAAAVEQAGIIGDISHVSTGGGASLELVEGRDLPGVVALDT